MLGHHKQAVAAMELQAQLLAQVSHFLPEAGQVLQVQGQAETRELTVLELEVTVHQQMAEMVALIGEMELEEEALLHQIQAIPPLDKM